MASANVVHFTDANFEAEVLKSSQPVLVDFGAEWCPPCKMLEPIIDRLATVYLGRVKVGKLDIDANQAITRKYRVEAVPTLMMFKAGHLVQVVQGLRPEPDLREAIDSML